MNIIFFYQRFEVLVCFFIFIKILEFSPSERMRSETPGTEYTVVKYYFIVSLGRKLLLILTMEQ